MGWNGMEYCSTVALSFLANWQYLATTDLCVLIPKVCNPRCSILHHATRLSRTALQNNAPKYFFGATSARFLVLLACHLAVGNFKKYRYYIQKLHAKTAITMQSWVTHLQILKNYYLTLFRHSTCQLKFRIPCSGTSNTSLQKKTILYANVKQSNQYNEWNYDFTRKSISGYRVETATKDAVSNP